MILSMSMAVKTVKNGDKILSIYQNLNTYSLVYFKNEDWTELVSSTTDWNYINYKFYEFCNDLGLNSVDEKDIENLKNNSDIQEIITSYLEDNLKVEIGKATAYHPNNVFQSVNFLNIKILLNDNMISYDSIML